MQRTQAANSQVRRRRRQLVGRCVQRERCGRQPKTIVAPDDDGDGVRALPPPVCDWGAVIHGRDNSNLCAPARTLTDSTKGSAVPVLCLRLVRCGYSYV